MVDVCLIHIALLCTFAGKCFTTTLSIAITVLTIGMDQDMRAKLVELIKSKIKNNVPDN